MGISSPSAHWMIRPGARFVRPISEIWPRMRKGTRRQTGFPLVISMAPRGERESQQGYFPHAPFSPSKSRLVARGLQFVQLSPCPLSASSVSTVAEKGPTGLQLTSRKRLPGLFQVPLRPAFLERFDRL